MNTDHDLFSKALLEELAAAIPSLWDKTWPLDHMPAAVAAYHRTKEQKRMAREPEPTNASLILAGVHSCSLATFVLEVPWDEPDAPRVQAAKAMAIKVLNNWGVRVEIESPEPAPATAPVAQAPVLVWPPVDREGRPLSTTLPDVYRENYYHVRETAFITNSDGVTDAERIDPERALVLLDAYWNKEELQWRMQFTCGSLSHVNPFWIDHYQLRVGEEIPKVIDSATQARSNDP